MFAERNHQHRLPKPLNANRICRHCFKKHVIDPESVKVTDDEIRAVTVCPDGCTEGIPIVITINKPQY